MRTLLFAVLLSACATDHAAKIAKENAEPKSQAALRQGASHAPSPDPWTGRDDLFVAPSLHPNTKVSLGNLDRFTLPNGLQVILVPRTTVASVEITLAIKAGHYSDPVDKAGIAEFAASMLHEGTKKRSSKQIAEAIDFVGGSLEAQAGDESTFVSCHARTENLKLCVDLVGDVSLNPTFPAKELEEIRQQLAGAVEQVKDSPQQLAVEHARNLYYGENDPRGRSLSVRSLAAIDRAALVDFHHHWFTPANAVLAISGDFKSKSLRAMIVTAFGGWKTPKDAAQAQTELPDPVKANGLTVRLVDKPDATQSNVLIVGPGIAHGSPDYYAVQLMNFVLGGGSFSSRLMKVIRSEGGKTYGAHSSYSARRRVGPFSISTFTRNSETAPTLKLIFGEIDKMRKSGPTDAELTAAKGNLIGGYGLRLETGSDLAEALLVTIIDALTPDFVEKFPQRMQEVTRDQAVAAAAAHLTPTAMVVVGRAAEVKAMLESAGYKVGAAVPYTAPVSSTER